MALDLSSLRTPGVYVEELNLLPPSVAAVETAIPAFFGYTEFRKDNFGQPIPGNAAHIQRIVSLLEYEQYFGGAAPQNITIQVTESSATAANVQPLIYNMYYALSMYFANGGGPCFIVSVGTYNLTTPAISKSVFGPALTALDNVDEPTLLVFPDAVNLTKSADYYDILVEALLQCENRGDRFLLCDVYKGDGSAPTAVADFREGIGANSLKYAAAYYPFLKTSMGFFYNAGSVTFNHSNGGLLNGLKLSDVQAIIAASAELARATGFQGQINAAPVADAIELGIRAARAAVAAVAAVVKAYLLNNPTEPEPSQALKNAQTAANDALAIAKAATTKTGNGSATEAADAAVNAAQAAIGQATLNAIDLAALNALYTPAFEGRMNQLISEPTVVLPPTPAVAGIYARVDRTRGVWKAPANVSLARVIKPTVAISDESQRSLNVDDTSGKSVNAIRSFTGKGILVWGARTLDGFSNEWRYVNVRRLFNMVEESLKKSTAQFVFEPNDANTWAKVKAMCENFLTLLWRQGALAGAKTEHAFRVYVGLNETMSADDILNGRLIIEIHMAAVRPAEFIVLRFAHKMQES